MTEKATPSETPRIEHLPSGLAMLCRSNGSVRPATKEELFFDSENSRLRDELAETERKYLDAWRESQIERAAAVAAESADHICHWHDHFVAEAAKCLAAERERDTLKVELDQARDAQHVAMKESAKDF